MFQSFQDEILPATFICVCVSMCICLHACSSLHIRATYPEAELRNTCLYLKSIKLIAVSVMLDLIQGFLELFAAAQAPTHR